MPLRENISYLVPRDPSIQCWDDRVKLSGPRTKNLIQLGLDEIEETVGGKIKVYLRLKPSSSSENAYTVLNSTTLQTEAPKESVSYKNVTNGVGKLIHKFTFTSVLEQDITQADLFKKCVVKSLKKFLNGENYLLMAYGTTSAGKTFTMQGNVDKPGVIPRALDFVFNSLKNNIIPFCRYQPHQYNEFIVFDEEQLKKYHSHKNFILGLDLTKCQRYPDASHITMHSNSSSGFSELYENMTFKEMQTHLTNMENMEIESDAYKYSVWVSMIEIYNEQVYDLLDFPNEKGIRPKLTFRDDEFGNTFVKNLRHVNVSSGHEAFQILQFGRSNLHFAPTALNQSSSRSHCIFTITVAKFLNYDTSSCAIMSRYSFCDLAGMERAKKTLNMKDRLVESKAINTSLSILVKCLTIIKENQNSKEKKLIPYRESKLTKLFREAVTGKEQFSLIVNITTEPNLFDETLNVLKFSAVAQKIVPQNVFVKPNLMRKVNKSRFSQLVINSSYNNSKTIDWDATTVDNTKVKEEYSSEIGELQDVIEKLKEELSKERKRCEEIENEIREELTSKFSEMLKKQRDNNEMRFESEREKLEEMYERKERRLIKYYEKLKTNKRKKMDEDDGSESHDCKDQEKRVEELQKEKEFLLVKNGSLVEQIQRLTDDHNKAVVTCSTLKFALAEKDRAFEELKRTMDAKTGGEGALELELTRQLEEAKNKLADYKVLLDEAASDYKELEENNKYLRAESEVLEQCLAEQKDVVADQTNEISELQKMLSQKRIMIEKLEDVNEKLNQQIKNMETSKEQNENSIAEIYKKELESLREQFKKTSEKLSESRCELEATKSEKLSLEDELQVCKNKISDLESQNTKMYEVVIAEKETEYNFTLKELQNTKSEVETLQKEKEILEKKCDMLNSEAVLLQKEIKDLLINSLNEKEAEELRQKLNKEREDSKAKERENRLAIEALQLEIEEAKSQIKEIPQLKEKIQNLIASSEKEIAELKEENERLQRQDGKGNNMEREFKNPSSDIGTTSVMEATTKNCGPHCESETEVSAYENAISRSDKESADETSSQSSGKENSPGITNTKRKGQPTPLKLVSKQMENLTLQTKSTRKKVDLLEETVHPSTLKRTNKGRRKKEKAPEKGGEMETSSTNQKGKCYKKLFTENDFDGLTDLNASPSEQEIRRLRPRK